MYYSRALYNPVPVPNTEIPNPIYDLMQPYSTEAVSGEPQGGRDNSVFQRNRNRSGRRKVHSPPGELLSQLIGLSNLLLDTLLCSSYE